MLFLEAPTKETQNIIAYTNVFVPYPQMKQVTNTIPVSSRSKEFIGRLIYPIIHILYAIQHDSLVIHPESMAT